MKSLSRHLVGSAFGLAAFSLVTIASAQTAGETAGETVAKVGEREITKAEVERVVSEMSDRLKNVPPAQRNARALDSLIDLELIAKLAEAEKLDENDEFKSRMAFERARALQAIYFRDVFSKSISDEAIKARYDEEIAKLPPRSQVRARHILVKTEDEAKAIIEQLKGGADFEALAKEKSTGPSGPRGGDLGFFGAGQMVPEFEKAAFALEPGGVTDAPVKTQFGYHVIKVEEKREQPAPELSAVSNQIRQMLLREAYVKLIETEREKAGVEITDDAYKLPQPGAAQPGAAQPGAAPATSGETTEQPKQ